MRAAVLLEDRNLVVKEAAASIIRSRCCRIKVLAVQLLPYAEAVVSGRLEYPHAKPPVILGVGALGQVLEVAEDVKDVQKDDIVLCDPYVGFSSNNGRYDYILQGWAALSPEGFKTQEVFRDGTFAEQYVTPSECLTIIRRPELCPLSKWATVFYFCVAQRALDRGNFSAGQVIAVSGATGGMGSNAVLLALAGGASKVFALGRNEAALKKLVNLDPSRVVAVNTTSGKSPQDALKTALGQDELNFQSKGAFSLNLPDLTEAELDMAVDALGHATSPDITLACLMCLKRGGTLILVGSLDCPLPVPYSYIVRRELQVVGSYMNSRDTPGRLIRLVESGVLNLDKVQTKSFPLAEIDSALRHARQASTLSYAILEPQM